MFKGGIADFYAAWNLVKAVKVSLYLREFFFFSSIFTSQFSIKSTTKKIEAAKCKSHFALEWSFFTKKKKTTILKWNIAGSRDANPHIEVLSAPTSPVEQTPLKSAIGRNPLRGSKCKSKTISFWFFYLSFILTDNWVTSVISVVKVGLSLHAFLFFSNFTKRVSWAFSFRCN